MLTQYYVSVIVLSGLWGGSGCTGKMWKFVGNFAICLILSSLVL